MRRSPGVDDDSLVWPLDRSEPLGDFRHFRVRRDWARSPADGKVLDFYVLDMPDWVQVIALTPAGRFVMVEQYRHGTRTVTREFPAGLVEDGETPVECAVRELEEETGRRGRSAKVIGEVHPNAALQDNRLHIVLVIDCRPVGNEDQDPGEYIRAREADPGEVDAMIDDGRFADAYGIVAWDFYRRWVRS